MKDGLKKHMGDAKNRRVDVTNTTFAEGEISIGGADISLAEGDI